MAKKSESGKNRPQRPEIARTRKDAIVRGVHERIKAKGVTRAALSAGEAGDLKAWLQQQPEVESVSLVGDADLTVNFKDNTRVGILLNRKNMYGGAAPKGDLVMVTRAAAIGDQAPEGDPYPISHKACVIDTLYDDWPPKSTPDTIKSTLAGAGYEVDFVTGNSANLKFFARLDEKECGVVFIRSHGGMMTVGTDNKVQIMVRPFFENLPPSSGYTGVEVLTVNTDVVAQGWAYVYSFNNLFVNAYMNGKYFPNTLFHLLVCHGADPNAQNDMIKSLLDRGAGCYTGWTKNASSTDGDPAAVQFFQVLCQASANPANTVTNAIAQITAAGHSPDPGSTAVLVSHGASALQIIRCFVIDEVSHIAIQDASGKVIRKGFHDVLDAAQYAYNQILGGKHSKLTINQTIEIDRVQW